MLSNNDQKLNSIPADSNNKQRIDDDTGNETMIEQTAQVISTRQGYAVVSPLGKKNCNGCASKSSGCSSQAFFGFFQSEQQNLEVLNPLHASPGDEVVIGVQGHGLLLFSLFAYLMPLLTLIVFALLGSQLFTVLGMSGELGAVLAGMAGLLGGFRLARFLSEISARAYDFQPVILRHNAKETLITQPLQFADFK